MRSRTTVRASTRPTFERLMQPFEQGENALTRQAEGAGLGLPIVGAARAGRWAGRSG